MSEESGFNSGESVDIEAIMDEIRAQIQERRHETTAAATPGDSQHYHGPLPAEFYDALVKAEEINAQLQPKMTITGSSIPIFGPIVQSFRRSFHELVLFYVNQLASNQIQYNTHLLSALSLLSEDVADSQDRES